MHFTLTVYHLESSGGGGFGELGMESRPPAKKAAKGTLMAYRMKQNSA